MKSGDIMGHEFMGEAVEVGAENKKLKIGDRSSSRLQSSAASAIKLSELISPSASGYRVGPGAWGSAPPKLRSQGSWPAG
jgi:hypothetical protein